jgi:hypothetical protein
MRMLEKIDQLEAGMEDEEDDEPLHFEFPDCGTSRPPALFG